MSLIDACRALIVASSRRRRDNAVDRLPELAGLLYRTADAVAATPWRGERNDLPPAIEIAGRRIDVVDDLLAYTGLSRDDVEAELRTRSRLNFRGEWHATPPGLRSDHWFYLSSKSYLFANAVHFADSSVADRVSAHVVSNGRVLDFGGGAGQLTLALAARSLRPSYTDTNAIQRDFLRFRLARHDLDELVDVLDPWRPLGTCTFDAIVAIDVLEHLPNVLDVLRQTLLPALKPGGVLLEDSPFIVNASNPMHHDDPGMDAALEAAGLQVVERASELRIWRRVDD